MHVGIGRIRVRGCGLGIGTVKYKGVYGDIIVDILCACLRLGDILHDDIPVFHGIELYIRHARKGVALLAYGLLHALCSCHSVYKDLHLRVSGSGLSVGVVMVCAERVHAFGEAADGEPQTHRRVCGGGEVAVFKDYRVDSVAEELVLGLRTVFPPVAVDGVSGIACGCHRLDLYGHGTAVVGSERLDVAFHASHLPWLEVLLRGCLGLIGDVKVYPLCHNACGTEQNTGDKGCSHC